MNIKELLLRGRETIAEHRPIDNYTSHNGLEMVSGQRLKTLHQVLFLMQLQEPPAAARILSRGS